MRTLDIDKLNIPKEIKEQYKHWVSVADDLLNVVADNTSVPYKQDEYTNQLVKALNRKYANKLVFYAEEELEIHRVYNKKATELHRLLENGATVHISKTRLQKLCKNNLSKLKEYNFITKYYYKMGDGQDLNFHNGLYIRVATIDELDMLERPYVDWE